MGSVNRYFRGKIHDIIVVVAELHPLKEQAPIQISNMPVDQLKSTDLAILQPSLIKLSGYLAKFDLESTARFDAIKPVLLQAAFQQEVEEMQQKIGIFAFQAR